MTAGNDSCFNFTQSSLKDALNLDHHIQEDHFKQDIHSFPVWMSPILSRFFILCSCLFSNWAYAQDSQNPLPLPNDSSSLHTLNYQGSLSNQEGTPLDGIHQLTFRLYTRFDDETFIWEEVHTEVQVKRIFFYLLR